MTARRALVWGLGAVLAFSVLLCLLALRELADDSRCSTGEFDTVQVERISRRWLPPGLDCEVTLRDGSTHEASVEYWPAFALAVVSGAGLVAVILWRRPETSVQGVEPRDQVERT